MYIRRANLFLSFFLLLSPTRRPIFTHAPTVRSAILYGAYFDLVLVALGARSDRGSCFSGTGYANPGLSFSPFFPFLLAVLVPGSGENLGSNNPRSASNPGSGSSSPAPELGGCSDGNPYVRYSSLNLGRTVPFASPTLAIQYCSDGGPRRRSQHKESNQPSSSSHHHPGELGHQSTGTQSSLPSHHHHPPPPTTQLSSAV